jgi:uncharacterized radical SAM superfamily Fe-S cluster-containing enzyme
MQDMPRMIRDTFRREARRILRERVEGRTWATHAYCTECREIVPGELLVSDGLVWLERRCPRHGAARSIQSRDPLVFTLQETLLRRLPEPRLSHRIESIPNLRGLFVDITDRCNMGCPNCLANSSGSEELVPPTLDEVLEQLERVRPYRPVVYLGGGEPTLHPELFHWVRSLHGRGYEVKLLTNGLKLTDREFCRELRDAGITWVLLQFDSPHEAPLRHLRGRPGLERVRREALANLSSLGMNICLANTVHREANLAEAIDVVKLGLSTPGVRHVSFMPARRLGRGQTVSDDNLLDELEMMEALEQQSGGAVRKQDWLTFFTAQALAYRLWPSPDLAPRRCFFALPLVGTADRFYPVTRPRAFLGDPPNATALARMLSRAGRIEAASWSDRALLISIEIFKEPESIDVGDAARCPRYYLHDGSLHQACIYNNILRPSYQSEHQRMESARVPA